MALIYEIYKAVSPSVCLSYVQQGNFLGWLPSNISELNPLFARSQTIVDIDTDLLFQAIKNSAPTRLDDMDIDSLVKKRTTCHEDTEGEYFGIHTDAPFVAHDGSAITKLSLVLYLNDDYAGGETVFPELSLEVKPESGKVLLFPPNLCHMSKPISCGVKYIVRSEVLYKLSSTSVSDTSDLQPF